MPADLDGLVHEYEHGRIDRRTFLKGAIQLGVALPFAGALIRLLDDPRPGTAPTAATLLSKSKVARSTAATQAAAKSGGQFVFVDGVDAVTLDPAASPDVSYSYNLIAGPAEALVEYVVRQDGSVGVGPRIAKSWKSSADFTTWTFELNNNVKFQDGTPCDAQAVADNINRILSINLSLAGRLGGINDIRAVTPTSVAFTLPSPNAQFLYPMTQAVLISPTAWKAHEVNGDQGQAWCADNIVGTGPYVISNRIIGSQTVMKRWSGYWRGWSGAHPDSVVVLVVPDASTRALMVTNGQASVANNISASDIPSLSSNPNVDVHYVQAPGVSMAGVRFKGPLADVNVRQAMTAAFDSEGFIASVMQGQGAVPHGDIYTQFPYFDRSIPADTLQMSRAKSYLAKSSYPHGGFAASFMILPAYYSYHTDMATIWQQRLKQLNITLNILTETATATYYASLDSPNGADMWAWLGAAQTPDYVFQARRQWYSTYTPPKGENGGYKNPTMDHLIDTIQATQKPAELKSLWAQVQTLLARDVPFIPFFIPRMYLVHAKDWGGLSENPFSTVANYYAAHQV